MRHIITFGVLLTVGLTACTATQNIDSAANYWQRSDTQSALYLRGPRAQHQLHKDMARCVAELKELQRLGSIRKAIPTGGTQIPSLDDDNSIIKTYDTPNRDGALYAEYYDFVDFEGCMREQGWQRARTLTPKQQIDAQDNWLRALVNPNWGGRGDLKPRSIEDAKTPSAQSSSDRRDIANDFNE